MKCELCGKKVRLGDWPHCPHESTRPERAQRFKAIVVFKRADGTYSFPASDTAKTPEGYTRVEITTRRQAERLEKEVNRAIREEKMSMPPSPVDNDGSGIHQLRRLARGERVVIPDHDAHGNLIMRELDGSQMRPEFKRYIDQVADRESAPQYKANFDPGFHIDIMHNNSSNRLAHDDPTTGWKSRRD